MTRLAAIMFLVAGLSCAAYGVERNPPPTFETGHELPTIIQPPPRWPAMQMVDVAALIVAIGGASYLALRRRSRRGMLIWMLACLGYFGFYRQGCICPIGAIQNITLAIFEPTYTIPLAAVAFFVLPLIAVLFWGRTFCAAVCPLGAVQDIAVLRPLKVPAFVEHALGLAPYLYMATAVLLAGTGSAFLICQYDPFVALFRLSGSLQMLLLGGIVLLIGLFVSRPYCRFLCPYGAILRVLSRLSRWHVTVTPDECIKCRMCEDACPFGAINKPTPPLAPRHRLAGKWTLVALIAITPAMIALGGLGASRLGGSVAMAHPTFSLARQIAQEEQDRIAGKTPPEADINDKAALYRMNASDAFHESGQSVQDLYRQAELIGRKFTVGLWWLGGFMGLVIGVKLISVSVRRMRTDYEPDHSRCVSCGRCFKYCPMERARLKKLKDPAPTP